MTAKFEINAAGDSASIDLFGPIGSAELNARTVAQALAKLGPRVKTIHVRIASDGGAVPDAIAIFNALKGHPARVEISILGWALSSASFIAMAGDVVRMAENALLMIHSPWGSLAGNGDDLRKHAEVLDMAREAMTGAYAAKSGKSRDEIAAVMSEETWFSADEALAFGLVDEIVAPVAMAASLRQECRFTIPQHYIEGTSMTSALQTNGVPDITAQAIDLQAELKRRDDIQSAYSYFMNRAGVPELFAAAVGDKAVTIEAARVNLLKHLGRDSEPLGAAFVATEDPRMSNLVEGAVDAILARAGVPVKDPSPLAADFRRYTMLDYAKSILSMRGKRIEGGPSDIIKAALSTSDFDKLLENTAGKALRAGYGEEPATHALWTAEREVKDFKTQSLVALSEAPPLEVVLEGAEYRYGAFADSAESFAVRTFGKIFTVSRQAIINDDLGAFTTAPAAFGQSARRLEADLVYGKLTANAALADGVALFHANHNNLLGATTLDLAGLGTARAHMRVQKGIAAEQYVDPVPRFLIVPVALETTAEQLVSSLVVPAAAANAAPEWIRNLAVVADPRLDASSTSVWYLAAAPSQIEGIVRAYIAGEARPYIEQQDGFERDVLSVKARLDIAAGVVDFRALLRAG